MNPREVRVVFMGTPAFAVPSLEALVEGGYDVVGVVTQPDRRVGRGGSVQAPDVKVTALGHGLPVLQPESLKDPEAIEALRELHPDLFVVAAFGKILSRPVLDIPARGCVNVHASLLPRWRGASPIAAAILAGDAQTGVSIMEMSLKMDAGAVIEQRAVDLESGDTTGTLELRLAALGAHVLVEALPGWYDRETAATPQDEALVTYCRQIAKEEGHLRAEMTATEAERAVRAFDPWPGAYVTYHGERLGIWHARVVELNAPAGALRVVGRKPVVAFREGGLELLEVQKPGGRRIGGDQFVNGERGKVEDRVGLV